MLKNKKLRKLSTRKHCKKLQKKLKLLKKLS